MSRRARRTHHANSPVAFSIGLRDFVLALVAGGELTGVQLGACGMTMRCKIDGTSREPRAPRTRQKWYRQAARGDSDRRAVAAIFAAMHAARRTRRHTLCWPGWVGGRGASHLVIRERRWRSRRNEALAQESRPGTTPPDPPRTGGPPHHGPQTRRTSSCLAFPRSSSPAAACHQRRRRSSGRSRCRAVRPA